MLRKIRITLAIIAFVAITLLFLDFTGTIHTWFGWLADIQFLPALMALNFVVIIALIVLTLVMGRVYCSIICPLGVMQDIVSWFSSRRKKKKARFKYTKNKVLLRAIFLFLFGLGLCSGFTALVSIIAPYSAYGRIASSLFAPLWQWGNNLLAFMAQRADSYAFYEVDVWFKSLPVIIVAAVTFVTLIVLAWRSGRTWCNTICPVGTVLGMLSKYSLFRPVIDTTKCNGCTLCSRKCKASCIDAKNHNIDYSRCVACMDCIDNCSQGAISYRLKPKKAVKASTETTDTARRTFIATSAIVGSSLIANAQRRRHKKVDGGLAVIQDKKIPNRATPIVPAGALSLKHLTEHCTACQLCISACPNQVLRPSDNLLRLMQPEMSYERGYCRPECTRCSDVCPTDAIRPITVEDKSSTQIGRAVWIKENCVVLTDNVSCGNCARHCPSGAIIMVALKRENSDGPQIPAIDAEKCIGCGACENLCPARPFSAIYVEGNQVHHTI